MTKSLLNKKGYSMIVLIIAIIVMTILAITAISSLRVSRQRNEAMNFIFDLTAVEDKVKSFYSTKGTLPVLTTNAQSIYSIMNLLSDEDVSILLSQVSNDDNDNYYYIDLSQLQGLAIRDADRGYFLNEASQKVYVTKPLDYQGENQDTMQRFFTLTGTLINGSDDYVSLNEDIVVLGNPELWDVKANLRLVLPRRSLSSAEWKRWVFKYVQGPKTAEEMELASTHAVEFEYGDLITVKSNGTYTFYVKSPADANGESRVTIKNVVVSKIDDIKPKYEFLDGGDRILAIDNESGIKAIRYKTLSKYNSNYIELHNSADEHIEARTNLDYYLLDGPGKDLRYELETEITNYVAEKKAINDAVASENIEHNRWLADHPLDNIYIYQRDIDLENARHDTVIAELNNSMNELNNTYSYLYDVDGGNPDSALVICIEDNAGNATVVGEVAHLSTRILADSYNISLDPLFEG